MKYIAAMIPWLFATSCTGPDLVALDNRYDYENLRDFGFLVCMAQSHRFAQQFAIAKTLDREAWAMVEHSEVPAGFYYQVFVAAKAVGIQVPANHSGRVCGAWRRSHEINQLLYFEPLP